MAKAKKKTRVEQARENEQKLYSFLQSDEPRPIYQGRLNKGKLLESLGIGSAARQNTIISEMLEDENIIIATKNAKAVHNKEYEDANSERIKLMQSKIELLTKKLALAEARIDEYRRGEFGESFLMKTGRLIQMRRGNPKQTSIDFDKDKKSNP